MWRRLWPWCRTPEEKWFHLLGSRLNLTWKDRWKGELHLHITEVTSICIKWICTFVSLLVDMKLQGIQLVLFRSSDHLLHLLQLLRLRPAGLQRGEDGLDSLGFLQQTPVNGTWSQSAHSSVMRCINCTTFKMDHLESCGLKTWGQQIIDCRNSLALFGLKQASLYEIGDCLQRK